MKRIALALVLILSGSAPTARAWTSVGTGIEYQEFHLPDPNNLFVARMDRHNPQCILDTSIGNGKLSCCPEIIRNQAGRYDDAVGYWGNDWGQRNDVIVAINGDFWNTSTGIPTHGQVQSGWYAMRIDPYYHFFYTMDRRVLLSQAGTAVWRVTYLATAVNQNIDDTNRARGSNELIVYTSQYDTTTLTNNSGSEVLVELARPNLTLPSSDPVRGRIKQIRQNLGSTTIPFDHIVLSANGSAATTMLANASVGAEVNLVNYLDSSNETVDRAYAAVGGGEVFLGNGIVLGGQAILNPRTAIAFNDDYVFFVVCDGRSGVSVGMTMTQLGDFCKDYLGATWGMNEDGGGSSTLVVNGVTQNDPSDGSDRAVANGVMMIVLQPKLQAVTYNSGDHVKTSGSSSVRLGPGTHFASIATVNNNTQGTVLDHSLRGIFAKGFNWWKCDFNGTVGWTAHTNLTFVSTGNLPVVTVHPVSRYICPGASTTFSMTAGGSGTLTYRWQRDGVALSDAVDGNGGHDAGSTTPTLSVSSIDASDEGSYRCVVTNSNGQTTSYSAGLTLRPATVVTQHPQPQTAHPLSNAPNAEFTVAGTGEGALSFRWQRNGQDLSDGAHYLGTATTTLTIVNAVSSLTGNYRCAVTANCGTAYSDAAGLTVISADLDGDGDADQTDFAGLQLCFGNQQLQQTSPGCLIADLDNDDHVNDGDLTAFLGCMNGANYPLPPGC